MLFLPAFSGFGSRLGRLLGVGKDKDFYRALDILSFWDPVGVSICWNTTTSG